MAVYLVTTTFGSFRLAADFTQSAGCIYSLSDDGLSRECTPYQVADALHRPHVAARLLLSYFGSDYWLSPETECDTDEDGSTTYDGMTKTEYLDSLIVAVAETDA